MLYEIASQQELYYNLPLRDIRSAVCAGERPELPADCPSSIRDAVLAGWSANPSSRPAASWLEHTIRNSWHADPQSGDSVPTVVTEAWVPYRIVKANAAWTAMCGYTEAEAVGKTLSILQGAGTEQEMLQLLKDAAQRNHSLTVCLTNYTKSGRQFLNKISLEWGKAVCIVTTEEVDSEEQCIGVPQHSASQEQCISIPQHSASQQQCIGVPQQIASQQQGDAAHTSLDRNSTLSQESGWLSATSGSIEHSHQTEVEVQQDVV